MFRRGYFGISIDKKTKIINTYKSYIDARGAYHIFRHLTVVKKYRQKYFSIPHYKANHVTWRV